MAEIPTRDRLIVALDLPTGTQALELADRIEGHVNFFKVGLELFSSGTGVDLIESLIGRGHKVFADFKLFDVPATVFRAVRNLNGLGITFVTVHGDEQIMEAAVEASDGISILAVTVLTSMDQDSLAGMGVSMSLEDLVRTRAKNAERLGCGGVVASPREAAVIRQQADARLRIVTPGIRREGGSFNDQKRVMTVKGALDAGADYVVVGRPIRDASDPARAAAQFQNEIADALAES
ncbi:MAG: orotidine-5'-phosphate decarboxylase [Acidiferrobacterales bacterium]|nr:orotidine-5'-phosphate decarboxylase [Acidiferrobacterales bacterium]